MVEPSPEATEPPVATDPPAADAARLRTWQGITVGTLFVGYAGYYVCRSVLPVVSNQLVGDPELGFDDRAYGRLLAVGIAGYAVGKLLTGVFAEYAGGKLVFVAGMILSALCVARFGLSGGFAALVGLWGLNRFVQSAGWPALVKTAGRWFPPGRLATVMGVLCLSYLFGDALARLYLGAFLEAGLGWRGVFLVAAGTLAVIAAATAILLRRSPADLGLPEPPPPPGNVHGDHDHGDGRVSLRRLLGPLLASRLFWLVCGMNMGLTAVRETFNAWTPRYLKEAVGMSAEDAGLLSFLFPLCGAVAALAAGWGADRLGGRFGRLIVPLTALTVVALGVLAAADLRGRTAPALGLIGAVALVMMGPYTYCSGVLALNLGGKRAAAASAGVIDGVGYLCGAVVSGELAGYLVNEYGFAPLLGLLFWLSVGTLVVAVGYWVCEERRGRPAGSGEA
jgi:OPA family glycerol-3-phosphate transporter-like MFS transporter